MKILFHEAYQNSDTWFRVTIYDTQKLKELNDHLYSTVKRLVEAAESGQKWTKSAKENSFAFCPVWYKSAECDIISTDYEHVIDVELV